MIVRFIPVALLSTAVLLGLFSGQQSAQASYNSVFNQEAAYAKAENKDITTTTGRRLNSFKSVYLGQNKAGKVRNVSYTTYASKQGTKFSSYANHWVKVRTLKNGTVYVYTDKTTHGNYLVAYHALAKRQGVTLKLGSQKVRVGYSRHQIISIKAPKHTLKVSLTTGKTTWDRQVITSKRNRTFKGSVPHTGSVKTRLVKDAKRYLGVPYRYAGRNPFGGLDCATFVNQVYLDVTHKDICGMTWVQQQLGKHVAVKHANTGDLLFWQRRGEAYTYHVAMAIGHGQLIEEAGQNVHISKIKTRQPQFAIHMH